MVLTLLIKQIAKENGMTLSAIARALGITRFNMSAIASGARGVSLKQLLRIAHILGCSIDEIIAGNEDIPVYRNKKIQSLLQAREQNGCCGQDKSWVHAVALAHKRHYGAGERIR